MYMLPAMNIEIYQQHYRSFQQEKHNNDTCLQISKIPGFQIAIGQNNENDRGGFSQGEFPWVRVTKAMPLHTFEGSLQWGHQRKGWIYNGLKRQGRTATTSGGIHRASAQGSSSRVNPIQGYILVQLTPKQQSIRLTKPQLSAKQHSELMAAVFLRDHINSTVLDLQTSML